MNAKKILIVGASGFVGGALKTRLEKEQDIQLFAPSSKEMDALDFKMTAEYIRKNQIEYVYHAAANHAGVGTGVNQPLYFLESNLIMNYNLVKASYENCVKKFMTFGTSCCYNDYSKILMDESDYWQNRSENTYGTCKRVMLEHLESQDRMQWVYLVPPNLYGPGDHFGEKNTHFIPATVQKFDDALFNETGAITVWGDGSQERDFVYIDDLIELLYQCLSTDLFNQRIVNVATAAGVSIKEVVLLIRKYMDCGQIQIHWDPQKPVGTKKKVLNNNLFRSLMPEFSFTDIETGIGKTIHWYLGSKQH